MSLSGNGLFVPDSAISADKNSPLTQFLIQLEETLFEIEKELYSKVFRWQNARLEGNTEATKKLMNGEQIEASHSTLNELYRAARWEWKPASLDEEIGPQLKECWMNADVFISLAFEMGCFDDNLSTIAKLSEKCLNSKDEAFRLAGELFCMTKPPIKEKTDGSQASPFANGRGRPPEKHTWIIRCLIKKGETPTIPLVKLHLVKEYGIHQEHPEMPTDEAIDTSIRRETKRAKSIELN